MERIDQLKEVLPSILEMAPNLVRETDNSMCGPCPICATGTDRFVYKTNEEKFFCRQCRPKGGDIIDLHCLLYNKTLPELFEQYGINNGSSHPSPASHTPTQEKEKKPPKKNIYTPQQRWNDILNGKNTNLDPIYRLAKKRGISKGLFLKAYNDNKIRFVKHHLKDQEELSSVACQYCEIDGDKKVLAIQMLSVDGLSYSDTEKKNKVFTYGSKNEESCFFQVGENIEKAKTIILCEAVINALSCAECYSEACILALGSATNTKKVKALRSYRDKGAQVICFFDNDKDGRKATQNVAKILGAKTQTVQWIGNTPDGHDVNDLLKNDEHKIISAMIENVQIVKIETPIAITKKKKPGVVETLVSFGMNNITSFFKDQIGTQFVRFPVNNHLEHWPSASKQFRTWLQGLYFKAENKSVYPEAMQQTINTLETIAEHDDTVENNIITLHNRTCEHDNAIWYDLSNEQWQAVKITKDGWDITDKPPPLFRRRPHQKPHVQPKPNGDLSKLYPFLKGIEDPEHKKIVTLWLISCFIPEFPHPILVPYGDQGSGKTTLTKNCKAIIDPSLIETLGRVGKVEELVQVLSHHWMLSFDNLSSLSKDIQDILCGAVTKSNFSKRRLFTDDEDIIISIHNCLIISGINYPATAPDLLDRCILIKLKRFSNDKNNKKEVDLAKIFQSVLSDVLGGIFDIISKAMRTKDKVKLSSKPRMFDFAEWGCAIAENMDGWNAKAFMEAYQKTITARNLETIAAHPISNALMKFMEDRDEWEGTAQELFDELDQVVPEQERKTKIWPKVAHVFTRQLNILKVNLNEAGIKIESKKIMKGRFISIVKNEVEKQDNFGINEI